MTGDTDTGVSARRGRARGRPNGLSVGAASIGLVLAAWPCGPSPRADDAVVTSATRMAEHELDAARTVLAEGDLDQAEERLRRFLVARPEDPLAPRASVLLAEIGLRRLLPNGLTIDGELPPVPSSAALAGLRARLAVAEAGSDPPTRDRAALLRGVTALLARSPSDALSALLPLREGLVHARDRALLETAIFHAARVERPAIALGSLDALRAGCAGDDCAAVDTALDGLADARVTADDLAALLESVPPTRPSFLPLAERLVARAVVEGDFDRVRALVARAHAAGVRLGTETESMAARLDRALEADPATIGVVAPLTGPHAQAGHAVVSAIARASGLPPVDRPDATATRVVVRDAHGSPEAAARAVSELFYLHRAIAIIGPSDEPSARAAAERASALGVPYLSLANVPPMPFVHPAHPLDGLALVDVARRALPGGFAVLAERQSTAAPVDGEPVVEHVAGRLSADASAELVAHAPRALVVLGRPSHVPRLLEAVLRAARGRTPPTFVLSEAGFAACAPRLRARLEGSVVVLRGEGVRGEGPSASLAAHGAAALARVQRASSTSREALDRALDGDAVVVPAVRLARVRGGVLTPD